MDSDNGDLTGLTRMTFFPVSSHGSFPVSFPLDPCRDDAKNFISDSLR